MNPRLLPIALLLTLALPATASAQQAPVVTITSGPSALTSATDAAFTYRSDVPGTTFECRYDGGAFAPCPSVGSSVTRLADGPHEFAVRGKAGAQTGAAASRAWTVDTTPPDTTIVTGPSGTTVDVAPTLTFAANETVTGFVCSVDGAPAAPCVSPFTTPMLLAGPHTVAIAATDTVGNTETTPAVSAFTLQTGLATLVDADRDGFPEVLDCNDRAAGTHPGAREVPGNTVDENCDAIVAPYPRAGATINAGGDAFAAYTRFNTFGVTGITPGARVEVRCSKRACPFTKRTLRVKRGRASVKGFNARVGGTVEVRVTAKEMIGKVMRLPIVKDRFPKLKTLCLPPGKKKPAAC